MTYLAYILFLIWKPLEFFWEVLKACTDQTLVSINASSQFIKLMKFKCLSDIMAATSTDGCW
ncbi:MAG: hypothetical protein IPN76_05650 [Saprospiraceae bacterium]|nr:hypothetical protein [Saprospiraceae bacterium]